MRPLIVPVGVVSLYGVLLLISGSIEALSTAERTIGRVACVVLITLGALVLVLPRGRAWLRRPRRVLDLGEPSDQWRMVLVVVAGLTTMVVLQAIEAHWWVILTIGVPAMNVVVAAIARLTIALRRRSSAPE